MSTMTVDEIINVMQSIKSISGGETKIKNIDIQYKSIDCLVTLPQPIERIELDSKALEGLEKYETK